MIEPNGNKLLIKKKQIHFNDCEQNDNQTRPKNLSIHHNHYHLNKKEANSFTNNNEDKIIDIFKLNDTDKNKFHEEEDEETNINEVDDSQKKDGSQK